MLRGSLFGVIAASLLALAPAPTAQAQTHERTLISGRAVSVASSIAGCDAPRVEEDSATLALDFRCQVADIDGGPATTSAEAALVVLTTANALSPRDFLDGQHRDWWPDIPEGQRDANIATETKQLANARIDFLCIYRDDVMNLAGDAVCLIDAPTVQMVVAGRSTMAFTADEAVDAVLRGVTMR